MTDETPDSIDRLDALLAEQEKAIRDAFRAFLAACASADVTSKIVAFLEQRDMAGAMKIVDSYIGQMANVFPRIQIAVGDEIMSDLASAIPDNLAVGVGFDPSLPRASEIIRAHRSEFLTDFTDAQHKATSQALARAYREGTGTAGTARAFRDSIGLTPYQEQIVANYRAKLQNLSRSALDAALRDKRSDGQIRRAIERNRPLTDIQIENNTQRYRRNYLQLRSETIARTEGVRATSEATIEANEQMAEQTGISSDRIDYIWNPTRDGRTRDWHASMAGQKRGTDGYFIDGNGNRLKYPGDASAPANTVINCRCVLTTVIRPAA